MQVLSPANDSENGVQPPRVALEPTVTTDGEKRSEGPGDFWIQSAKVQWSLQSLEPWH